MTPEEDRQVQGALDAVDRMIGVVDTFEEYVFSSFDRDRHGMRYRLNLLWVHSFAALLMAPLLSLTGRDGLTGPSFSFMRTIPAAPYSVSALLGASGLVLGMGCIFRAKRVEMAGLIGLTIFYLIFCVSFAIPPLQWIFGGYRGVKPPLYASILYLHLSVIMLMHIRGLVLSRRDDKAVAQVRKDAQDAGRGH